MSFLEMPARPALFTKPIELLGAVRKPVTRHLSMAGTVWTVLEKDILRQMIADGATAFQISAKLQRTIPSVCRRANAMGLSCSRRLPRTMRKEPPSVHDIEIVSGPIFGRAKAIIRSVAAAHDLTENVILSGDRSAPVALARQQAMWLCARDTKLSYPQIGRIMRRDHTTVIHGVRRINGMVNENVREAGVVR